MPHTNNPNGKWELPSGHIELDESAQQAAVREWEEETGLKLPPGRFVRKWDSSNGKFVGFVYEIDSEDQLDLRERDKDSNPDGDHFESLAWVDPHDMPYHNLRHELMDDIGRVQGVLIHPIVGNEIVDNHSFSSTQFDLTDAGFSRSDGSPIPRLQQLQDHISNKDLAEDGKEERFHITVKYGIHTNDADEVREVVLAWLKKRVGEPGFLTIHATLGDISLFSNPDADVVKVDIDSEDLHSLNKALSSSLDCTDTHPTYKPHITLAYVKPGCGSKYARGGMDGQEILLHKLIFSDKDGQETVIDLWELGKDLRSNIQENTQEPTENERTEAQRQAALEARQATAVAYRVTKKLPGEGETYIQEGRIILSPRAKAHQHAGLAMSRSKIPAFGLAYMHHTAAAVKHNLAAEENKTVGERLLHRDAAEAHEEAALKNKIASKLIETVRNEEGSEGAYITNSLLTYNVLDISHKGELYSIYKNPSTRVIKSILKSDPYHGIRGLIHPDTGDVYLWGNGEGGLEHKEVVNHYLREELPYNSHKIYIQQVPPSKEGHPPEIHMDARGRSSEHITNFAKQHGIHIMGGMADNREEVIDNEWSDEARRKSAEARRMRKKVKPDTSPRPVRQEPIHQPAPPAHDVAKNRPTKPHERRKNSAPPVLAWRDPPPKKGKKGTGPIVRPKGDHSQTKLGDHAEELATSIGFRNILPEGKRSNKSVAEEGSSIDLEWNHSGKAFELKMCSTNSTEFRLKAKSSEKSAKMEYAKKHGLEVYTLIGVRDADRREIHYYASKEPGLIGAEVSDKNFHYCGSVSF